MHTKAIHTLIYQINKWKYWAIPFVFLWQFWQMYTSLYSSFTAIQPVNLLHPYVIKNPTSPSTCCCISLFSYCKFATRQRACTRECEKTAKLSQHIPMFHQPRWVHVSFLPREHYVRAVLGVVILSVRPSVRLSVCLSVSHTRALWQN